MWRSEGPFDEFYDVPYTTITTNQIAGGIAMNTIPDACEFTYEFRNLASVTPQQVQERIGASQQVLGQPGELIAQVADALPGQPIVRVQGQPPLELRLGIRAGAAEA